MENQRLNQVIEAMVRIPPIMHRKLHREFIKAVLQQFGADFAPHHLMIMKELQESGTLHSSEIAEAISVAKSQMTHSIDKLIGLGMAERGRDAEDRRKINIRLTQKGLDTVERLNKIMKDLVSHRLSVLSDDELRRLAESFNCIAETFSKLQ
jgi:DNA-binding MarR family transcriptional regulator